MFAKFDGNLLRIHCHINDIHDIMHGGYFRNPTTHTLEAKGVQVITKTPSTWESERVSVNHAYKPPRSDFFQVERI